MTLLNNAILDLNPPLSSLKEEVLMGLRQNQKQLHPKLFYDEKGSRLFNQITTLPEYYLTRVEKEVLACVHEDIGSLFGSKVTLIELGCGNEEKIQLLLKSLRSGNRYIPIDISREALHNTVGKLKVLYPFLDVQGIRADYTQALSLLFQDSKEKKVILFLGSTIGNFDELERNKFLQGLAEYLNPNDGLLIGIDLIKSNSLIERAYNDSQGITAAFNKNLLQRINREFHANFQVEKFTHHAFYNTEKNRIEMHLISESAQEVCIGDETFSFLPGETIHTENSYKFNLEEFQQLLANTGLCLRKVWTDKRDYFAVTYIEPL